METDLLCKHHRAVTVLSLVLHTIVIYICMHCFILVKYTDTIYMLVGIT